MPTTALPLSLGLNSTGRVKKPTVDSQHGRDSHSPRHSEGPPGLGDSYRYTSGSKQRYHLVRILVRFRWHAVKQKGHVWCAGADHTCCDAVP